MSADEMFEELGFEKSESSLIFFGEAIPFITYSNNLLYKTIGFNLRDEYICVNGLDKDYKEVLQAINKKVEELGWIKE